MTTLQIFRKHNIKLMNNRIPSGNEPLETFFTIDPRDEIFDMPLSKIIRTKTSNINSDKKIETVFLQEYQCK
jgi:hypothetical protein